MSSTTKEPQVEIDPETGFVTEVVAQAQQSTQPPAAASLDQVREILFGAHSRDLEQRLTRLEQRLDRTVDTMHVETTNRLDTLERYIKNELTMLLEKLGTQREERTKLFQQMRAEVEEGGQKYERKINDLAEQSTKSQSEIRAELLRQVNTLVDEIEKRCGAIGQNLTREVVQLRGELVDRSSLSAAFSEVALRMTGNGNEADVEDDGES